MEGLSIHSSVWAMAVILPRCPAIVSSVCIFVSGCSETYRFGYAARASFIRFLAAVLASTLIMKKGVVSTLLNGPLSVFDSLASGGACRMSGYLPVLFL